MQIKMFEGSRETIQQWVMTEDGLRDAAAVFEEILRGDSAPIVSFQGTAARKMGIEGTMIPADLARDYADQVDMLTENRLRIKELVEAGGRFQLVVVDRHGQSAIGGGRRYPFGFALRNSEAGVKDDDAQCGMAAAKIVAIARRERLAGLISAQQEEEVRRITTLATEIVAARGHHVLPEAVDESAPVG